MNNAVVTIAISPRFQVIDAAGNFPAYCAISGAVGAQTLTCNLPALGAGMGNSQNFTFKANAIATGASDTTASIAASGNTDGNAGNNALTVTPTVRAGVDLTVTKTGSAASVPAGGTLTYTLTAANSGPNTTAAIRVTDNLPAASDFQFQSASGTNWSCGASGTTVTCDYTGAALALPATYPAISITGKIVKAVSGTITNIASVQSTDTLILDRNGGNDTSAPVVTTITDGSDIQATKSMPGTIVIGSPATITIGVVNNGPQAVPAGARVADTIASNLTIGAPLPAGCTRAGATVTCTAGALAAGASATFAIPVTGTTASAGNLTNTATMTPPSGFTDALLTNNSAAAVYTVLPANADLGIASKTKGPSPIAPGSPVTSTIVLQNFGPSDATYSSPGNPIVITDAVGANETYVSSDTAWNCSQAGGLITCRTTGSGTLPVGGQLTLSLVTQPAAGTDTDITNTACTDRTASSTHQPSTAASATGNDCFTAVVRATTESADLAVLKDVSLVSGGGWTDNLSIANSDAAFFLRLRVSNVAGNTARTVNVADVLPNFLNESGFTTAATLVSATKGSMSYSAGNGLVSWSLTNLAAGQTETLIVRIDRPFESGSFTNTATVSSPDTTETSAANNSDNASYTVAAIADMTVNAKTISPNPARVGAVATYVVSVRNSGANAAQAVVVTDTIDPARFDILGTPTTTKSGATCTVTAATGLVSCAMGDFARTEVAQIIIEVRPRFPFGGIGLGGFPASHTNRAKVTTSTLDTNGGSNPDAGNNFFDLTHDVGPPSFDLAVTKTESDPVADDPIRTDETLKYDVRISNYGPSRATNILLTDIPAPPAGGTMTLSSVTINPVGANNGLTLQAAPNASCVASGANYICKVDSGNAEANFLDPLKQVVFRMVFDQTSGGATGPVTFTNTAELTSAEHPSWNGGTTDTEIPSNRAVQTTTVLPSTDLEVVSKTRTGALVRNINEPVEFTIRVRNNGPTLTTGLRVTDALPAGFTYIATPAPTAAIPGGSGASVSAINCSGANTVLCVLTGNFPAGAGELVDIKLNVRAADPFTGALDPSDQTDTASIAPGLDNDGNPLSEDGVDTNNSQTAAVRIQQASIAGTVYADNNRSGSLDNGEALNTVTLTLTGKDVYGNDVSHTVQTGANGTYLFDRLPPAGPQGYTITETQPGGHFDATEVVGSAGGTADNASFTNAAAQNLVSGIVLNAGVAATGYDFREFAAAQLSGYIYRDQNNDGTRSGAGETGFGPGDFAATPQLRLTGTDYAGNPVDLTASVDGAGAYAFNGLAPSDTTAGYTVTQLVQPNNASDGLESNGAGNVLAGTSGRTAPEGLPVGVVAPAANLPERNFGELPTSTLSGRVYFDPNANAVRDGAENAGIAMAILRLTGTNDLSQAIDCSVTTDATGNYSFPINADPNPVCRNLRPGTYTITETAPAGMTHTGAYIGSSGGTSGGTSGANTAAVGAANVAVTSIVVTAGSNGTNYDFGENGQGLSGAVYVDANRDGQRTGTEAGIAGVVITLSGTTSSGQNVCDFISCTATTNAAGTYSFLNLPGSSAAGYTITQQSQAASPLSAFADGQEKVGGNGTVTRGTAGADVFTGVVNAVGEMLSGYDFGEFGARLAGTVYIDRNNNGTKETAETGISGVSVTLSGTTNGGQDICAYLAALAPAGSCSATTVTGGGYDFGALPAGTYVLTESQPSAYADGKENPSTPGSTFSNASFTSAAADNRIANIVLAPGANSLANLFGELGVTVSGRVYKDPQRDGVDASEPGIVGVTIRLMQGATVVATTTTAADGSFSFPDIAAGTYTIEEIQPAGYGSSTPNSFNLTLVAGADQSVAFGETVSTISGNVFIDASDDGKRQTPAEKGLGGVVITLTGTDAAGASVNRTATTAADGTYKFADLLAGTYELSEAQPAAFADGNDSAGSSGGTVANDKISAIVLATAVDATAYDFGEHGEAMTGKVYDDRNRNGRFDGNDTPIAGVRVELQRPDGSLVAFALTDATGTYTFKDVEAGDYVVVEIQPNGFGDAAENTANKLPFTVVANQPIASINFGERTGSLSGLVYNDSDRNGLRSASEPAIPGVTVTLSGTTARGEEICAYLAALTPKGSCIAVSDATGAWAFTGLPGGTYAVTETQPAAYNDGAETVGSAGGTAGADVISGIVLATAGDASGYLFGEQGNVGQISGTVWFDANHDRKRDAGEQVKAGWTVQLWLGNTQITSTTTKADGTYEFANVAPGVGYRVRFISPEGITFSGARTNENASTANPGNATIVNGEITNISVVPGTNVPQQSLPLDPSGVVYDAVRRVPVEGAKVTITGPAGFDPAVHLIGGTANVTQTTGDSGFYQYLLMAGAPSGTYSLAVVPPSGSYNPTQPSTIIPPCPGTQTVGATPNPYLVSLISGAPANGTADGCTLHTASTAYFLSFNLTVGVSADVLNNNIPLDPILKGALVVTKVTPKVNVSRGELVPYTITARNTLNGRLSGIAITDRLPAGFQYRTGSARIDGVAVEPVQIGRVLSWRNQNFAARAEKKLDLLLVVGAGVAEGEHVNQAYAINTIVDTVVSDIAEAAVRIVPDPDFDCSDIIGKVFDDRNVNGMQDAGEPGLPGVRLATVNGLLITTDQYGRYHVTCPMIPNEARGSNFILKLDVRTLPSGYRVTTGNPETVRLTRGKFATLNFGASITRVVRADITGAVFEGDKVSDTYRGQVEALIKALADKPSVLRVAYARGAEDDGQVRRRLNALKDLVHQCWKEDGDRYRLIIEEEIVATDGANKGDVK